MKHEFDGFEHPNHTQVPNDFFDKLLPLIDDKSELKVILIAVRYTLGFQRNQAELSLEFLRQATGMTINSVRHGVSACLNRGTMTIIKKSTGGNTGSIYGVRWSKVQGISHEYPRVSATDTPGYQPLTPRKKERKKESTSTAAIQEKETLARPNVFVLYEKNIGLLNPMIAEELKFAETEYPTDWIEDAFKQCVLHNKRNWAYAHAILKRWQTEGRGDRHKPKDAKTQEQRDDEIAAWATRRQ